jgi:hypothetical protein
LIAGANSLPRSPAGVVNAGRSTAGEDACAMAGAERSISNQSPAHPRQTMNFNVWRTFCDVPGLARLKMDGPVV